MQSAQELNNLSIGTVGASREPVRPVIRYAKWKGAETRHEDKDIITGQVGYRQETKHLNI